MAPWKPLGGYEQQRKANVKGVVWETDQRPWEETTGGKYETERKISTVESDEGGEANAGANNCFMVGRGLGTSKHNCLVSYLLC